MGVDPCKGKSCLISNIEISGHQFGTILKSSALTFNPRLSSLVPLHIVLVECKKHCFRLQNTRERFFLHKKPGKAAPHRIQSGNAPMYFKFSSTLFQITPYPCMGPFSEHHQKNWMT